MRAKTFRATAAAALALTGSAKMLSGLGSAKLLETADPIFGVTLRMVLLLTGIVECLVAVFCLLDRHEAIAIPLVAWLAASFLAYRLGLWWIGWHRPCPCLGTLTDALGLSPAWASNAMKLVAVYLLAGSYALLFCRREPSPAGGS